MNVQNISLSCCPKPKHNQNFEGASITTKAMRVITNRIAKNPLEMDDFKAIGKLDVNIDLDKYSPNNIEFLVIRKKNDDSQRLLTSVDTIKKLRERIERFITTINTGL